MPAVSTATPVLPLLLHLLMQSGSSMGVAVCRHRGSDVAATVVDFVFDFVFVFVAPRRWGCGVLPFPSCRYQLDGIVSPQPLSLVLLSHEWRQKWR
jgi:hypothetical protein